MELNYKAKSAWEGLTKADMEKLTTLSNSYVDFLNAGKTERECCKEIIRRAKETGFKSLDEVVKSGKLERGTKVYLNNKDKSVVLGVIGKDLREGANIIGAHIDSPRLDLKQMPLYQDVDMAFLKTHYYGGVKKYQWTTIPLAIHGVIYTKEGKMVEVCYGEDPNEPVLFINDLLIHLSRKQLQEKMADGITGEQLNVLVGSQIPACDCEDCDCDGECGDDCDCGDDCKCKKDGKDVVKNNILKILNKKYGIIEEDFRVAELEIVPAGKARHCGFDNSMIIGHGHDDRCCAYTTLEAVLEIETPQTSVFALFADKEEIGSVGNTGMQALYFENMVAELLAISPDYRDVDLRRCLAKSRMLSADVSAGYDPAFPDVFEKMNSAYIGKGICINKYTGSGGKGGSNDANAEFLQQVRQIFDENKVVWQTAELGKIDAGGGGTIAYILAKYGTEVVDCGIPVLSMHAPHELLSKADLYMAYKAYLGFFKANI